MYGNTTYEYTAEEPARPGTVRGVDARLQPSSLRLTRSLQGLDARRLLVVHGEGTAGQSRATTRRANFAAAVAKLIMPKDLSA